MYYGYCQDGSKHTGLSRALKPALRTRSVPLRSPVSEKFAFSLNYEDFLEINLEAG